MENKLQEFVSIWVRNDLDNDLGQKLLASGEVSIAANGRVWFKTGVFSNLVNELQTALKEELGRTPTMGDLNEYIKNNSNAQ